MKKVLSLLLVLMMVFGCVFAMTSCGKDKNKNDNNNNQNQQDNNQGGNTQGGNDEGGIKPPTVIPGETVESDVECVNADWKSSAKTLIMSISDSSNNKEMLAGGRGYVSGNNQWSTESAKATDTLLKKVIQRNSDAAAYANVSLAYTYTDYLWGKATGAIAENIASGVSGMPDVYYEAVYDMVASSLKGNFQNVLGNAYFNGDGETPAEGYNRDYMDIMTFSKKAEYLIASDYSVDISRSFFILPVNMNILVEKAALIVEDRNLDGFTDVDDFFDVIDDEDWTWDFIAQLCEAVKVMGINGNGEADYVYNDGVVGMCIDSSAGLAASGICYASELKIIDRTEVNGEYVYNYDPTGAALSQVAVTLANSVNQTDGFVTNNSSDGFASATEAIANAFGEGHILIGNVIVLGAIEQQVYRDMWDSENDRLGFVCAPMPLYSKGTAGEWTYHTVVHNLAKVFGIATTCAVELDRTMAFLDYASTHSTEILNDFYTWTILMDAAGADDHNVKYLTYMKDRMEYNLDKTVDDALGVFGTKYGTDGVNLYSNRWHVLLRDGGNGTADDNFGVGSGIVPLYEAVYAMKQAGVAQLQQRFLGVGQ